MIPKNKTSPHQKYNQGNFQLKNWLRTIEGYEGIVIGSDKDHHLLCSM